MEVRHFIKRFFNGRSLILLNIQGEMNKDENSYTNIDESAVLIHYLKQSVQCNLQKIGVMSPYSGQVKLLNQLIKKEGLEKVVEVNTVDGYQG